MQRHDSKRSVTSVTSSSRAGEKKNLPTHMIIQRDNDNKIILLPVTHLVNSSVARIKLNNTATFKSDLNNRKQERGRIIQLGNKEECSEQLQIFEMTADLDEESSVIDGDDELNENNDKEENDDEKNKTSSKKQVKTSSHTFKRMNNRSNSDVSIASIKQATNIVKPKNLKSKYLQIDEAMSKSSSSEDDSFVATSKGSFRKNMSSKIPVRSSTAMPSKKSTTAPAAKKLDSEHDEEFQGGSKSEIIIGRQSRNIKSNLVSDMEMLENLVADKHQQNMNDNDMIHKYEALSKKCNELGKENLTLQSEHDRLLKENEVLKKTTMPIPDAAGRLWFINMGKYFSGNRSDTNISKHAEALNVNVQDLIACIEKTTSSTARQVVKLVCSSEKLLNETGPDMPETQRTAIRNFAESQRGPIDDHQFNEAINGVFRSKKNEFKKQQEGRALNSASGDGVNTPTKSMNKGQKSLKQFMNKKKCPQLNRASSDKENNDFEENHENNE